MKKVFVNGYGSIGSRIAKFVKEIAKLNGKIDNFVTKSTIRAIKDKI